MSSFFPIFLSAPAQPKTQEPEGVWCGARGEAFSPARTWWELFWSSGAAGRVSSGSFRSLEKSVRVSHGAMSRPEKAVRVCARSARVSFREATVSNGSRGLLFFPAGVWSGVKEVSSNADRDSNGCGGRLFRGRGVSNGWKEASFPPAGARNWHERDHFSRGTGKNFPQAGSETGAPAGNWDGETLNFELRTSNFEIMRTLLSLNLQPSTLNLPH